MKANEISNMLWQEIIQLKLSLEYNDKLEKSGVYFVFFFPCFLQSLQSSMSITLALIM